MQQAAVQVTHAPVEMRRSGGGWPAHASISSSSAVAKCRWASIGSAFVPSPIPPFPHNCASDTCNAHALTAAPDRVLFLAALCLFSVAFFLHSTCCLLAANAMLVMISSRSRSNDPFLFYFLLFYYKVIFV